MIRYTILPKHPAAHIFEVTVTIERPAADGQRLMLPVWIPGSYMIREFARHIVSINASANGAAVTCSKVDKSTWQCAPCAGPLTVVYEVYAWDLSVRAAHLDDTHGFFNGTSVFLLAEGFRDESCEIEIKRPAGVQFAKWQIASALPAKNGENGKAVKDFGFFVANNYDELIDHPVEMGTFTHASFEACGIPHHIAITGRHRADMARLCTDFKKFCEAQIRLFEPQTAQAPMAAYWFLIMVVGNGFGGLEHRASTALLVSRDDLPVQSNSTIEVPASATASKPAAAYRKLLSLASHEYFHTWNVKRILPAAFVPYDFAKESYTRQLWFFEGITDYYDDLMLVRAGIITPLEYLEIDAENIGRVLSQAGRTKQSVAESSFDAWTKYYRQDENAVNSIVSYYQKGAIIGLALDLMIRDHSAGKKSLDDVMRALWNRFAKSGRGVPEGEIEKIASEMAGADLSTFFAEAVYGTTDLDLVPLFATVGVTLSWRPAMGTPPASSPLSSIGAKIGAESNGDAKLLQVFAGGAALAAGLSAGDTIVALDGLRVNAANLERRIKSYEVGNELAAVAFRRDELLMVTVLLQAQTNQTCVLTLNDTPAGAKVRREAWLQPVINS